MSYCEMPWGIFLLIYSHGFKYGSPDKYRRKANRRKLRQHIKVMYMKPTANKLS